MKRFKKHPYTNNLGEKFILVQFPWLLEHRKRTLSKRCVANIFKTFKSSQQRQRILRKLKLMQ